MIEQPKHLLKASDGDIIWRYMDLSKLMSIIIRRELWFTRLDKLTDQYEGIVPIENQFEINSEYIRKSKKEINIENFNIIEDPVSTIHRYRSFSHANSWTVRNTESFALWKIYLSRSEYGVAIKTSIKNFVESLNHQSFKIMTCMVNYYDPQNGKIKPVIQETISGSKMNVYEYESEFRALILNQYKVDAKRNKVPKYEDGIYVPIDIEKLLNEIYISPGAPDWFVEIVTKLVDKYHLKPKITQSYIKDKL